MSEQESANTVAGLPVPVASAPKLTAIQRIEQELGGFIRQREQAVANVHAIEGAIQGAQHLLTVLRQEEAKAAAEFEKVLSDAKSVGEQVVAAVEAELKKL